MMFLVFSNAGGILISQYLGAGQKENASQSGALALVLHLVSGLVISLLVLLFSSPMLHFIGADASVFEYTRILFFIEFFLELGRACNLTIIPCLRGAGDVRFPTLWAIFSNMFIGLGGSHLLAIQCHMGIYGLWIAMALDELFRAVIMLIRWHGSRWKNKQITASRQ